MLISRSRNYRLNIELHPITDPAHAGWHSYSMLMERTDIGISFELQPNEDAPLFLDWAIDPEISNLCSGVRSVLSGSESSFSFSPVDDGDFVFSVRTQGANFLVQITIPDYTLPDGLGWPTGVVVNDTELSQFVSELEVQLSRVTNQSKP